MGQYPRILQNFWDLLHARTQHENNNHILHGDQTRCEENFYMVDHHLHNLLAVANLVFTGWMPLLLPNQQSHRIEGKRQQYGQRIQSLENAVANGKLCKQITQ